MKKDRIKKVKYYLKQLTSNGLNVERATQGKTVEEIARTNNSLNNFIKRYKREKERPKIEAEVNAYDKKVKDNLHAKALILSAKQMRKATLSNKTWNIITKPDFSKLFPQFQNFDKAKNKKEMLSMYKKVEKSKPLQQIVEELTEQKASDFFYTYFKELKVSPRDMDRVDKLVKSFGSRFDVFNDLKDDILNRIAILDLSDTDEIIKMNGDVAKFDEMRKRLSMFEDRLTSHYGVKL